MEPEGSSSCLKEPAIRLYAEPIESSSHFLTLSP
jgi:hypothetical protein